MKHITPWWWLWLALVPICGMSATNIIGFHVQDRDKEGYRALVFDLDGSVGVSLFTLDHPDRVVIDLPDTHIRHLHQIRAAQDTLLRDVRAAFQSDGRLRVVLDVVHPLWARSYFTVADKKTRLVVELRDASVMPKGEQATTPSQPTAVAMTEPPPVPSVTPIPPVAGVSDSRPVSRTAVLPVDNAPPHHSTVTTAHEATVHETVAVQPTIRTHRPLPSGVALQGEKELAHTETVTPAFEEPVARLRDVVIAVDPGHGGKDPGTTGPGGTEEKNVTLAIARDIVDLLRREHGIRPMLTRTGDYFVPLRERIQKARAARADLFISIHADAASDPSVSGASVYVLSEQGASSDAARVLAEQENAVELVSGARVGRRDNNLARTLLDMSQNGTREASFTVATRVLSAMAQVGALSRDNVERAGFLVLKSPDVPSLLVETDYLSNPAEEEKLNDPSYQQTIARAVVRGIRAYFLHNAPAGTVLAQATETTTSAPPTALARR